MMNIKEISPEFTALPKESGESPTSSPQPKEGMGEGITFVMPVYNRAGQVSKTLECLSRQTRRPEEVILVDNGSTDGSIEVLNAWASTLRTVGWRVRVLTEPRRGAACARQRGLEETSTRYVMFFDSDDLMEDSHIEHIMKDFESDPSLDIAAWPVSFLTPQGRTVRRRILPGRVWENHMVQGLISTQAMAVRTDFIRRAGGWDLQIGGWDDWELGVRLLLHNPHIKVRRDSPVLAIVQENSISGLDFWHRHGDWERTLDAAEKAVRTASVKDDHNAPNIAVRTTSVKDDHSAPNRAVRTASIDPKLQRKLLTLIDYRRINLAAHYWHEGHKAEGRALAEATLASHPPIRRMILRMAYRYTSSGFPFAGALFPPLLRTL